MCRRGDASRYASSASPATAAPAADDDQSQREQGHQHQQPQQPQPREAGIMYRVGGDDDEEHQREEEEVLRSFQESYNNGGGGGGGGERFNLFSGLFGGGARGSHDDGRRGGGGDAASSRNPPRPAARLLAPYGYNIRITPWVVSIYCCMFFYNVVICNDGRVASPQENPLIGGSKSSMLAGRFTQPNPTQPNPLVHSLACSSPESTLTGAPPYAYIRNGVKSRRL